MNILIIGSGGREHALAWKIAQSPLLDKLYCCPGNPGTAEIAENIDIDSSDFSALIAFCKQKKIALTVVGPEAPLVEGIVDAFEKENLSIFGPGKEAAQLEGSKVFSKNLMKECEIPTAAYSTFDNYDDAKNYLDANPKYPIVLKADGLAAGKGVIICENRAEAYNALNKIMQDKKFGDAGDHLVIEEFLRGNEVSVFAICDGSDYVLLPASQDHKKVGEGDTGENTGGMGAYAPTPLATAEIIQKTEKDVIKPLLLRLKEKGIPYKGLLYVGLIIVESHPYVLEFNCRFGDPETQAVLPLIKSDLLPYLIASAQGNLAKTEPLEILDKCSMDIVLASGGYPGAYEKNKPIEGLNNVQDVLIFHAGTKNENDQLVTSGGRVLNVVAIEDLFKKAFEKAYQEINKIKFDKMYFRKDIGFRILKNNE